MPDGPPALDGALLLDLRAEALRLAQPLPGHLRARAVSLEAIEEERHGLTPADGPLVVVCERGARSALAARLLRADGLTAASWPGGVPALLAAVGQEGRQD